MGLSSNILWHQTKKNNLINILTSKQLSCSYCLEDFPLTSEKIAFPMVSLCDLPFSEFASYLGKYGDYSIGFTREWGIKNMLNPVWYCDDSSSISNFLKEQYIKGKDTNDLELVYTLIYTLAFIKRTEGPLYKHNYKKYRYSDEREVRFVPSFKFMAAKQDRPFLRENEYIAYKKVYKNGLLSSYGLSFDWEDIKYIVVKEDKHIEEIRNKLETLNCSNSKIGIFSTQQIKEDFIGVEHNIALPESKDSSIPIIDLIDSATMMQEIIKQINK